MAWASRAGRAFTDTSNPRAQGQCDRCGQWWNLAELRFQFDYRGPRLANTYMRVCEPCYDTPCVWFKPIVVPADPVPVPNPRPAQTNTGSVGWGMGGWSTGAWSVGQSPTAPAAVTDPAPPPMTVDEE